MTVGAVMGVAAADISAINAVAAAAIEAVNRVPFPAGGVGPIDPYLTDLHGAFSLSKLVGAYTGPCLRVRESSGNTEQDIYFDGGEIDVTALLSFVGANSAYVVTWYDQSGGANNLTQATAANQPQIVDAGLYLEELFFDGVNDTLQQSSTSGAVNAITVYCDGRERIVLNGVGTTAGVLWFLSNNPLLAATEYITGTYTSDYGLTVAYPGSNNFVSYDYPHTKRGLIYAVKASRTGNIFVACKYYVRGSEQTHITYLGAPGAGNFTAGVWLLGASGTNTKPTAVRSFVVYYANHSGTTVGDITAVLPVAPPVDALDSYTTSLWGLYSLRRQLSGYADSCIRVRRSSDNAEQDIGFVAGRLDTSSLLAFAGANSAFVTTWYDQSGGAKNLTQATAANQPRVVNAGVLDIAMTFDGTNDFLASPNSGTPNAFTAHFCARINSAALQVLLEQSPNNGTNTGANAFYDNARLKGIVTQTSGANNQSNEYTTAPSWQVNSVRWNRSLSAANKVAVYNSGVKLTPSATSSSGTAPTGNFVAHPWYVGARSNATFPLNGEIDTVVIYETSQTDATIAAIARMIG